MPLNNGANNTFYFYPSRLCMGLLLLIHVAALLCIFALPLKWWAYLLIATILAISLIYYIELYVRFGLKRSIRTLEYEESGDWVLCTKQQQYRAKLLADSVVTNYMLILNFRLTHKKSRRTVLVFKDALTHESFRQLRLFCLQQKRGK